MTSGQKNNETGNLLIQLKNCSVKSKGPKAMGAEEHKSGRKDSMIA